MTRIAVDLPGGRTTVTAAIEHATFEDAAMPAPATPDPATPREARDVPWAAVALAHGAGAGMDHPLLLGFAAALRAAGVSTMRFAFPYREAGRRMPGPAAHAVATWSAVMTELAAAFPGVPHVAAGKSYGGRMASMAAADGVISPAAIVYLGYPFHPPGKPDATRGAHLARVTAPQLFIEGTADPFIQPVGDFEASLSASPSAEILWVDGGGHSFEVTGFRRAPDDIGAALATAALPWLRLAVG